MPKLILRFNEWRIKNIYYLPGRISIPLSESRQETMSSAAAHPGQLQTSTSSGKVTLEDNITWLPETE